MLAPLVSLAEDAADGADQHGVALGLAQNSAAKIRADLATVAGDPTTQPPTPGAQAAYTAAKAAKTAASAAQRTAESNARAFVGSAIGVLKNYLGRPWSSAWVAAGFVNGSLAVPDDPLPLLGTLRAYFTQNPAHENAPLGVTAAACHTHLDGLSDARMGVNLSNAALGAAKQARDAAQETLYKRLCGLRAELAQLLADDDARWYAFGFDRPSDGEHPASVQGLVLTAGGPGVVLVDWDDARRAERYRVLRQVVGMDAAPVLIDSTLRESEVALRNLPSGKQLVVTVSAVNDAGEGPAAVSAAFGVP